MKFDGENGVIAHYILDCQARNRSVRTIEAYSNVLRLLSGLLKDLCFVDEIEGVTVLCLRQCVQHLLTSEAYSHGASPFRRPKKDKMLSVRSVHDYVLVWKAFFNWCYQEELIEKNPADRLKAPRLEKKVKETLSSEELQKMLDSCDLSTDVGFRDYTILSVMADTGLRLSELAGLRVADVHSGYIKVFGKGRKEREIGVHPEVSKIIWKYIHKYRQPATDGETSLFLGRWGESLGSSGVSQVVGRIKDRCGFGEKQVTPHIFRHTFSKQYMKRGGDLLNLSRELGHSDIQVTRLYLQDFGSEDARVDHNQRSVFNDIKLPKRGKSRDKQ